MPAGTTFPLQAQPSNGMQDPSTTSFAIATGGAHGMGAVEARLLAGFIEGVDSHPGYSASKGVSSLSPLQCGSDQEVCG
jgi:hypothetical protein